MMLLPCVSLKFCIFWITQALFILFSRRLRFSIRGQIYIFVDYRSTGQLFFLILEYNIFSVRILFQILPQQKRQAAALSV